MHVDAVGQVFRPALAKVLEAFAACRQRSDPVLARQVAMQVDPLGGQDAKPLGNDPNRLLKWVQRRRAFEAEGSAMTSSLVSQDGEPREPLAQRDMTWKRGNFNLQSSQRDVQQPNGLVLPVACGSALRQFSVMRLKVGP